MNLILNIYKEKSLSSFDVIRFLRRKLHEKRIGFQGTLDVFAEGVLPVFTGEFTKIIPFIQDSEKEYRFKIVLGILTDTLDMTGKVLNTSKEKPNISKSDVEEAVKKNFMHDYLQRVPAYSAVKINGTPAYKLARRGEEVATPSKKVIIKSFEIESSNGNEIIGKIVVSPGFYVRQFANDLAKKLFTFGVLSELTRTRSGNFRIEDSIRMADADEFKSISVKNALKEKMETVYINEEQMKDLKNGRPADYCCGEKRIVLAMTEDDKECVVAETYENKIKAKRVIY
ncbi:MAG: tRNA pseudouridine(55) synthase TruB [bacterium]|nr:tRNA pseudouridine(55) synthase TruB [bacterium]